MKIIKNALLCGGGFIAGFMTMTTLFSCACVKRLHHPKIGDAVYTAPDGVRFVVVNSKKKLNTTLAIVDLKNRK